jgi:hypothetical protein
MPKNKGKVRFDNPFAATAAAANSISPHERRFDFAVVAAAEQSFATPPPNQQESHS